MSAQSEADAFLLSLLQDHEHGFGLGSMTSTIYDTAWVSCVSKDFAGRRLWQFPTSFSHILDCQSVDGGWQWPPRPHEECHTDSILSSLAALFSISQHMKHPYQLKYSPKCLLENLQRGQAYLSRKLKMWEVKRATSVGFEVLVPAMLDLLEREHIEFSFPGKQHLFAMRDRKLSRILVQDIQNGPSTLLHSFEALFGHEAVFSTSINHHLVDGSMMASPSATAALLMQRWDERADAYLHIVMSRAEGQRHGAVPSAYPSSTYELIWVASTLLEADVMKGSIDSESREKLVAFIEHQAKDGNGLLGFSPGIQPDLDDTAKGSTVLSLLGRPSLSTRIRDEFETGTHFSTYSLEQNPSFSSNCNALMALLLSLENDDTVQLQSVEKVVTFLCNQWYESSRFVQDKWNVSPFYSVLLLVQALMQLLRCWASGRFPEINQILLQETVLLTLLQCLIRLLNAQNIDGSWGDTGPQEETCYSILALKKLGSLPLAVFCFQQIVCAIDRGQAFLSAQAESSDPEYLWVEKVRYGSRNLSRAYAISAKHAPLATPVTNSALATLCKIDSGEMAKFADFFQQLPLLKSQPRWLVLVSWIEAQLFLPRLSAMRGNVFSRTGMTKDKYFNWIPVIWTSMNSARGSQLSSRFLFDMMTLSVLNYQADEYMESVVGGQYGNQLLHVRNLIKGSFLPTLKSNGGLGHCQTNDSTNGDMDMKGFTEGDDQLDSVRKTLSCFISFVTNHPGIAFASSHDKEKLWTELELFLFAHVTQVEDNQRFALQKPRNEYSNKTPVFQNPRQSFQEWLSTTSSQHTSCPYSFAFTTCLIGSGEDVFSSIHKRYAAADLCRHLSAICRLYNDHGSVKRDRKEWNLNSVNFPEFHCHREDDSEASSTDEALKARLMELADYERRCLELAMKEMEKDTDTQVMDVLRVFVDVTDLFGQIYVIKDIASQRIC